VAASYSYFHRTQGRRKPLDIKQKARLAARRGGVQPHAHNTRIFTWASVSGARPLTV
jgi:hypothetical protein